jgi:iron complex outermembrane receptor protein
MKLNKLTAALFLAAISQNAQSSTILDEIYVTDNAGIINDNLKTAYSTQTFTKEDIEASGATDLGNFLTQNTNLNIQPQYGNPMTTLIDMNGYGLEAGHTNVQIILNGVSLNAIDSAPVILNFISLDSISNISILRGSGSVLYGNGATAGAIIINTDKNFELPDQVKATLQIGSYGESKKTVTIHKNGSINSYQTFIDLGIDLYNKDGSIFVVNKNSKNQTNNRNLSLQTGLKTQKTSYTASIAKSDGDTIYPDPISISDFNNQPNIDRSGGTSQEFEKTNLGLQIVHHLTAETKVDYNLNNEQRSSEYSGSSPSEFNQTEHKVDFKTRFDSAVFTYGGSIKSAQREANSTSAPNRKTTRDDKSLFISADVSLNPDFLINAGYRKQELEYDYKDGNAKSHSESYDLRAYNLGTSWLISQNSSAYLNYNHAFNAPNLDQLFNWDGSFNGSIAPMETDTVTLGYKHQTDNTHFVLEAFKAELKDELFYNPATYSNTNIDSSTKTGINISLKQYFDSFVLGSDYAFVDAKINEEDGTSYSGNKLPGVSEHTIKVFGEYDFNSSLIPALPMHSVRVTHKASSGLYAISDFKNTGGLKPGYTSTDVSYKLFSKNATVQMGINNLFNQKNGVYVYSNVYTTNYERTFYIRGDVKF